ncbi:unnamed protein product [Cylindrotheca closterium]|uniref:Plastid lipid-associated protein/fibrillin conserved domain-containing protein n=1 Tax=Cylindrotheca closterium TaxID=2856 RepID=A0AAD2GC02_9STRA|nr:unnamed protein product [Cylindrotheca closterium]
MQLRSGLFINLLLIVTLFVCSGVSGFVGSSTNTRAQHNHNHNHDTFTSLSSTGTAGDNNQLSDQRLAAKDALLSAISSTPSNAPTSRAKTDAIMQLARDLESQCPTPEEQVLDTLQGSWELLWTAQDRSQKDPSQLGPFREFINPLENQSYSNNPNGSGRANPFLPQGVQEKLEDLGIVAAQDESSSDPVRSSQNIDLKRQKVRNVVSFAVPFLKGRSSSSKSPKASLTVTVDFKPNLQDQRKIDVKFQECRVVLPNTPVDLIIPLGIIGPTGWLRTGYIDDSIRITRGHKGSVFVLARPRSQTN